MNLPSSNHCSNAPALFDEVCSWSQVQRKQWAALEMDFLSLYLLRKVIHMQPVQSKLKDPLRRLPLYVTTREKSFNYWTIPDAPWHQMHQRKEWITSGNSRSSRCCRNLLSIDSFSFCSPSAFSALPDPKRI